MHHQPPKQPLFNPVAKRLTLAQRQWLKEKKIPPEGWLLLARLMLQDSPSRRSH